MVAVLKGVQSLYDKKVVNQIANHDTNQVPIRTYLYAARRLVRLTTATDDCSVSVRVPLSRSLTSSPWSRMEHINAAEVTAAHAGNSCAVRCVAPPQSDGCPQHQKRAHEVLSASVSPELSGEEST